MKKYRTLFLDRDGTINKEKNYVYKIEDFEFIDGCLDTLKKIKKIEPELKIVIITNQSGIGRKYYSEKDFHILTDWMINRFRNNEIDIEDVLFCPHAPDENCKCRKPDTGLAEQLKYEVDFPNSWMVGDKESDIEFGINSGIKNNVLVRSGHKFDEKNTKASYIIDSINSLTDIIK